MDYRPDKQPCNIVCFTSSPVKETLCELLIGLRAENLGSKMRRCRQRIAIHESEGLEEPRNIGCHAFKPTL